MNSDDPIVATASPHIVLPKRRHHLSSGADCAIILIAMLMIVVLVLRRGRLMPSPRALFATLPPANALSPLDATGDALPDLPG
jgi:hypothetical protein